MFQPVLSYSSGGELAISPHADLGPGQPDDIRLGRYFDLERSKIGGRMFYGGDRHVLILGREVARRPHVAEFVAWLNDQIRQAPQFEA